MRKRFSLLFIAVFHLAVARGATDAPRPATAANREAPAVSIIIDDLGRAVDEGMEAIRLPGPVACSFLPHQRHTVQLAALAHANGKEVMLHLPMQSVAQRPVDAGGLWLEMTRQEFLHTLADDLDAVPHVSGVNNHMGSLMTQHPGDMNWLMQALRQRGDLFFVDSRTTPATVALQVALENGVPSVKRDVFLDDVRTPEAIAQQFRRLIVIARRQGTAVAIGHPHPVTLAALRRLIPQLRRHGIRLVPVSDIIRSQHPGQQTWQASLAPASPLNGGPRPLR